MANVCDKCLYSEHHPFGLSFNDGVCTGCYTHSEKYDQDWGMRFEKLLRELDHRRSKNSKYDCVVPVTGDAEDYYVVSQVLKLNLRPLIVSVNNYFLNDIGWQNLHNLITIFDVDSIIFNPEIATYKELVAASLKNYDSMYLPFLQLHTSFPVHIAVERGIKLVIWGQNQSIEQAGKFSHDDETRMSAWNRKEHDLFQVDVETLIGNGAQVATRNLNYYEYPSPKVQYKRGVVGLYLSNYLPWDPLSQNSQMTDFGFYPQVNAYSFDPYERAGSSVYYGIHDLLKSKKHGYRKIRDHLCREIRHGRVAREDAVVIEENYSNRNVEIRSFFDWIGATESGYKWFLKHRLKDSSHIVSEESQRFNEIDLPDKIASLLKFGQSPTDDFITFGKGIDI